jgi:CRISPR-associated protein Csm1
MTEKNKLVIGSLLHDIGKIVHRSGYDGRNHSQSGHDWLRDECGVDDEAVSHCVLYHHGWRLKNAKLMSDDVAYITYAADNIASAIDRREMDSDDVNYDEPPFSKDAKFESVFNLLYGRSGETMCYPPVLLAEAERTPLPTSEPPEYSQDFYSKALAAFSDNLRGMPLDEAYTDSLLEIMEANLSFIPSTTGRDQVRDISLFDHSKITAAVASCIFDYLGEKGEEDYRAALFENERSTFAAEDFALLYSLDMSGIQSFIYTIRSEGALQSLRGRSFYLEIMMEHLADTLLEALCLSRANLLYTGGGHLYMLLPNTEAARAAIAGFERDTNHWFLEHYGTQLYVAGGYAPCSENSLKNEPAGSFEALHRRVSEKISEKKMKRYSKDDILFLNSRNHVGRECRTCKTVSASVTGEKGGKPDCPLCECMKELSKNVIGDSFFAAVKGDAGHNPVLPGGYSILALNDENGARELMGDGSSSFRIYGKNKYFRGKGVKAKLWVGDYHAEKEISQYTKRSWSGEGIARLGVLRLDVDNLGDAFVRGFAHEDGRYNTLSRTSQFSRSLSMFFKHDINAILNEGNCHATIIYSGGDDVFLIGAWDDVINAAIKLREQFTLFSQGKLTLSAGIGIYPDKFPIHVMARESGELEAYAKRNKRPDKDKDSIALFDRHGRYGWDEFIDDVIGQKLAAIREYFHDADDADAAEQGNAFLYRLLSLIREQENERRNAGGNAHRGISFARWAYTLARMEPRRDGDGDNAKWERYKKFAERLKGWFDDAEDARKLAMAIELYVYEKRETKMGA